MKNKLLWVLLALLVPLLGSAQKTDGIEPQPQQARAALFAAQVLDSQNYAHVPFDAKMSSAIFDNYIKVLDPERLIFLQSDIDQYSFARYQIGQYLVKEDLRVPFAIYNLNQKRITEHLQYAQSLLKDGFDFSLDESYQPDRRHAAWPGSEQEMNDLWRKRVKNDWLRLKLAGKDDPAIVEILRKRYENSQKSILRTKSDDIFQVFMDAYATAYDPHTNYFGMRAAESFAISMKLSLTGIGAELQYKDEYITIRHLVPGSPSELSGQLKAGDRIVSVGQGESGSSTDIMGMSIFDAVELIRGPEDSTVRLEILPAEAGPDGHHKFVTLVRKKITLEKQAAKKSTVDVKDGATTHHVGVIALPGFYRDFAAQQNGDKDFRSAARDVAKILTEFNNEKVDGVVLDLRNNGGGSVEEAIELIGLFIAKGPVMQQRDVKQRITTNTINDDSTPLWNGPFGVLVNQSSASASEIFAAAIQDYGRGLVIGEPSFGKGTTQSLVNLSKLLKRDDEDYGELKLTITKWFRVNGDAIQLRGVTPDVALPMLSDTENYGESSFENALPWEHIPSASYERVGDLKPIIPLLIANHNARTVNDKAFQDLQSDINEFNDRNHKNQISLNEAVRRKEREADEVKLKQREADTAQAAKSSGKAKTPDADSDAPHLDDGLLATERDIKNDTASDKADNNDKDILLKEAAHIVEDEANLIVKK